MTKEVLILVCCPETEARLGVFYVDLEYNSSNKVTGIKDIPSVDENKLRTAIDCLESVA